MHLLYVELQLIFFFVFHYLFFLIKKETKKSRLHKLLAKQLRLVTLYFRKHCNSL